MSLTRRHIVQSTALAASGLALPAWSNAWPTARPISMLCGYPPGGSTDMVARTVSEALAKRLGTPVVVENIGGAGGTIAGQRATNAEPDGHTLILASGNEATIARMFNSAVKYNGETDWTHIGLIGATPMVLIASQKSGIKTLDDAIARSRREPGKLTFASSGVGTALHISGELVNMMSGSSFRHVPYRGAAQQIQDLLAGNVDMSVSVLVSALPHIESGRAIPLALTTKERSRLVPGTPAMAEHPKLKGFDVPIWFGLFGPKGLPSPITARLNKELNDALRDPAVWGKLQRGGITNDGGTPQQLSAFMKAETARLRAVITQIVASGVSAS
jgi:tripartite-type tricarboxylate transporter receptor subunit TctC